MERNKLQPPWDREGGDEQSSEPKREKVNPCAKHAEGEKVNPCVNCNAPHSTCVAHGTCRLRGYCLFLSPAELKLFEGKFIVLWDNEPLGVDDASGGYPYKTSYPGGIHWFPTRLAAEEYIWIFQRGNDPMYANMQIKSATIVLK